LINFLHETFGDLAIIAALFIFLGVTSFVGILLSVLVTREPTDD